MEGFGVRILVGAVSNIMRVGCGAAGPVRHVVPVRTSRANATCGCVSPRVPKAAYAIFMPTVLFHALFG